MSEPFIAWLLLVMAPGLWWARRSGLFETAIPRLALAILAGFLLLLWRPTAPLDGRIVERWNLLLLLATLAVVALRHLAARGWSEARHRRALWCLAAGAITSWTQFGNFHLFGGFTHYHDVPHYYLGGKYAGDVGRSELYAALLRAEWEDLGGRLQTERARDLDSNHIVDAASLLPLGDAVAKRMSPEGWQSFRRDAAFFRELAGTQWPRVVQDHGFNPTPLWSAIGGGLAKLVPADGPLGLAPLLLLDPLLLLAATAAAAWAFGLEATVVAAVVFSTSFGGAFSWIGGAYLRQLWFASWVLSMALLHRGHAGAGGATLALAAMTRVFPGLLVAGFGLHGLLTWGQRREVTPALRFSLSFATAAIALAAGATAIGGLDEWREFLARMSVRAAAPAGNDVGFSSLFAAIGVDWSAPDVPATLVGRRIAAAGWQLLGLAPLAALLSWRLARRLDPVRGLLAGSLVILLGLNLASYYCVYAATLVLAWQADRRALLWVLAGESALYVIQLFESDPRTLYLFYRAPALLWVWLGVHAEVLGEEVASWRQAVARLCGTRI